MNTRPSFWYDIGWPVLAGLVTAAGLLGAYVWMGPPTTLIALVLLELTFAPVMWSILSDAGYSSRDVILRLSPAWSVGSLAFIGLVDAFDAWSLLIATLVLVTSPPFAGWARLGNRKLRGAREGMTRNETQRRFDEIVAHGFNGFSDDDLH